MKTARRFRLLLNRIAKHLSKNDAVQERLLGDMMLESMRPMTIEIRDEFSLGELSSVSSSRTCTAEIIRKRFSFAKWRNPRYQCGFSTSSSVTLGFYDHIQSTYTNLTYSGEGTSTFTGFPSARKESPLEFDPVVEEWRGILDKLFPSDEEISPDEVDRSLERIRKNYSDMGIE